VRCRQGFLFARPLPADEVEAFLAQSKMSVLKEIG
jgi:hypothetical protein